MYSAGAAGAAFSHESSQFAFKETKRNGRGEKKKRTRRVPSFPRTEDLQFGHCDFESTDPFVATLGLERSVLPRSLVVDQCREREFPLTFEIFDREVDRRDEVAFLRLEELEHAHTKGLDLGKRARGQPLRTPP